MPKKVLRLYGVMKRRKSENFGDRRKDLIRGLSNLPKTTRRIQR